MSGAVTIVSDGRKSPNGIASAKRTASLTVVNRLSF
jgi:hypothetical protein